jgi:nicotinamide riboside transporter PnuC
MNLDEARKELNIQDDDLAAIRRKKDPNWLVRGVITLAVVVVSYIVGYFAASASSSGTSPYPYGMAAIAPLAVAQKRRVPWLFVIVLAVLSFISISVGVVSNSETFGVVTYYGAFSRKG